MPQFHPNAHIPFMRNRKAGLKARTLILNSLIRKPLSLRQLRSETKLSFSSLNYHIRLLEKNGLIRKRSLSKRQRIVEATGKGQQPILPGDHNIDLS